MRYLSILFVLATFQVYAENLHICETDSGKVYSVKPCHLNKATRNNLRPQQKTILFGGSTCPSYEVWFEAHRVLNSDAEDKHTQFDRIKSVCGWINKGEIVVAPLQTQIIDDKVFVLARHEIKGEFWIEPEAYTSKPYVSSNRVLPSENSKQSQTTNSSKPSNSYSLGTGILKGKSLACISETSWEKQNQLIASNVYKKAKGCIITGAKSVPVILDDVTIFSKRCILKLIDEKTIKVWTDCSNYKEHAD